MNFLNDLFLSGVGLIGFLIALIPLIIAIALIVAIFQINGRIAHLIRLQQQTSMQLSQTAELQRQAFIAHLAEHGPNHKEYLDYLVDQDYLTPYQAEFVLRQSGNSEINVGTPAANQATDAAFIELVEGNSK